MAENEVYYACAYSEVESVLRERLSGRVVDELLYAGGLGQLRHIHIEEVVAVGLALVLADRYVTVLTFVTLYYHLRLVRNTELYKLVHLGPVFRLFAYIVNDVGLLVEIYVKQVNHVYASEVVGEHEEITTFGDVRFCGFKVPDSLDLINREPGLAHFHLWQLISCKRVHTELHISAPFGIVQQHHKEDQICPHGCWFEFTVSEVLVEAEDCAVRDVFCKQLVASVASDVIPNHSV